MNWQFWRKNSDEKENKHDELERLQQQVDELQEHVLKVTDQLKKLSRHQVKTSKNIEEKLDNLPSVLSIQTERDKLSNENNQYQHRQKQQIESHLAMIDEMDHVSSGIKEADKQWEEMLKHWIQTMLTDLKNIGVYEVEVLGKGFDPQLAESMQTVAKSELASTPSVPYQVVEVLKRGFVNEQGKVIRKAQVITVEGDVHE
ncbi:nucleotide exchange factor GrpE [Gracilibacillus salinarum]|uniref:Nucleotide exchange factor GrpE n=1 Tax=Gracilibacillus salinarum TaxID=2932255 RepID=A0ABY4GJF7_9BACI|nr:nucleotide exchange factor GrpE [Gracilibacillus salinarum]UOQ83602.1 nucleotide exchange factor GrpE [Gracilibacillus salinarum]